MDGNFTITNKGAGNINLETTVSFGASVSSHIRPKETNEFDLGSNDKKWRTVYATNFNGNITGTITGNADTATYADNAGISTNLKGGTTSQIPYQSAADTTAFIPNGTTAGQLLQYNSGSAPSWVNATDLTVSTATQVSTGSTDFNSVHYLNFSRNLNVSRAAATIFTDSGITYNPSTNLLTVGGDILPLTGNYHNLGSNERKWNEVHANKYLGSTTSGTSDLLFSGNLKVGNGTTENYIVFHGTTDDGSNEFNHTYIGERIYETGTERSELLLFKGNDPIDGVYGKDRIRLSASEIRFDTYDAYTSGTFSQVAGAGTNKVIILSSGNVGIGTTTPSVKLHVNGTIVSAAGTLGSNGNGAKYISTESPSSGSDGDIWYQIIS